jgi:hypothetical protein
VPLVGIPRLTLLWIDDLENGAVLFYFFAFEMAGSLQFSRGIFRSAQPRIGQAKIMPRFMQGRVSGDSILQPFCSFGVVLPLKRNSPYTG